MTPGLGYKPDTVDARDHDALKVIRTTTPPAFVARSIYVQTLDQGALGSCTCNAVGQAIRAQILMALVAAGVSLETAQAQVEFLARLFPYYLARSISQEQHVDAGTMIRFVFQVLNTFGFPPESAWTYSDDSSPTGKFAKMPSGDAFRLAFDQKMLAANGGSPVVEYARIASTGYARVDDVKRAHGDGHLVVFGTDVTNHFCSDMSANNGKPIDPPTATGDIAGGHAMVTGGHDASGADVLNSWGTGFGDGGWFKFSWDYIAWAKTGDLWIVKKAPLFSGVQVTP